MSQLRPWYKNLFLTYILLTILNYHVFFHAFLLMINLHFLSPAVNTQICNSTAEREIPTETPTNKANAEIKTHSLKAETQMKEMLQ